MNIKESDLNSAYEQYHKIYGGVKNDYFAPLYLMKKFNRSFDDVSTMCAFGNNDYGFDAFYCDREAKTLHLFQFKWSNNYKLFQESYERIINKGFEYIFGNSQYESKENKFISKLKLTTYENKNLIDEVFFYFVFNGNDADLEKVERSKKLENDREDLENKNYYLKRYFNDRDVKLTIVYVANKTDNVSRPQRPDKIHSYDIHIDGHIACQSVENDLFVSFVSLWNLYQMYKEMGPRFFERNIRAGLSSDNPPNRSIRNTLKKVVVDLSEPASDFSFKHNGVALAVEKLDFIDGRVILVEPRVLNGAQTITSFAKFYEEEQKDNPAVEKNINELKSIKVLAKIIVSLDKKFVTNVTICNNKQNPVEPWNLHANDDIQTQLEDKFRNEVNAELGIGYERLENYYNNMRDDELEEMGIQFGRKMDMLTMAKTILAMQGEVAKMSSLNEIFESEKEYEKVFRASYLSTRTQKMVLSYKIVFKIGAILRCMVEKAESYYYMSKGRNLVWALLIQALLNDTDLDELCDKYGNDLYQAADYYDYLKRIASIKLCKILQRAVRSDQKYIDSLKDDKFSFMRTKSFYDLCMDIARDEYDWGKRSF